MQSPNEPPPDLPEWLKLWLDVAPYTYGSGAVSDTKTQDARILAPTSALLRDVAARLGLDGWFLELLRYSAAMCIEGRIDAETSGATLRGFSVFHGLKPGTALGLWHELAEGHASRDGWVLLEEAKGLPLLDRPIIWSPAILDALLGILPPDLMPAAPLTPDYNPGWSGGQGQIARLRQALDQHRARILLIGPALCGKTSLLQSVCDGLGRAVFTSLAQRAEMLERHARYATLTDGVLHLSASSTVLRELSVRGWSQWPGSMVLEANELSRDVLPLDLDPPPRVIELGVGNEAERMAQCQALLERHLGSDTSKRVGERHVLSIGDIERIRRACLERGLNTYTQVSALIRTNASDTLRGLAQLENTTEVWSELIASESVLDDLTALCQRYQASDALRARFPDAAQRVRRRAVALFGGPPGVGKTMAARLVAARLELPCLRVDLSQVVSKYIGETEKRLGQIFDEAQRSDVVLLFDEADSLFARRTNVRTSHDRYANLEVAYLLQRLESFEGVAILTSNLSHALDEAFERRIDFHVRFEIPDSDLRERLWVLYLPEVERPNIDVTSLAEEFELSGAMIRKICERAMYKVAAECEAMSTEMLSHIAVRELGATGALIRDVNATDFDLL